MKLLINTSNLYVGGGLQVALSFINELKDIDSKNEYYIFLSQAVEKQINQNNFDKRFHFYLIEKSPAKLFVRSKICKQMDDLESQIRPDIIFTIFGPSYWKPNITHLIGFADGWVYNPTSIAYDKLSFLKRLKMKLFSKYKLFYLNRDADYYVLETKDAINKLSTIMKKNIDKFFVVGNTYSNVFNDKRYITETNKFYIKLPQKTKDEYRFVYIAHNHPSKNLSIIKLLIPFIKEFNIKFILTIDSNSFDKIFKDTDSEKYIINVGPIPVASCPSLYIQSDALFAPTLLETFSASYPEAMKIGKPIITSEYSFAKDICQDSAIYFNPLDPKDISEKIINLIKNKNLSTRLIEKGLNHLTNFETAKSRAVKYIEICENLIKKDQNVQK